MVNRPMTADELEAADAYRKMKEEEDADAKEVKPPSSISSERLKEIIDELIPQDGSNKMTDKPMTVPDDNHEYLILSINQAEILSNKLTEALDSVRLHQSLGDRIDSLVIPYPKENRNE